MIVKLVGLIVVLLLLSVDAPAFAQSRSSLSSKIPEDELIGPQHGHGRLTLSGLKAIEAAIPELIKQGVRPDQYKSVYVNEATRSFHVQFSTNELGSETFDSSSGFPPGIIVRIDKVSFKVLNSVFY